MQTSIAWRNIFIHCGIQHSNKWWKVLEVFTKSISISKSSTTCIVVFPTVCDHETQRKGLWKAKKHCVEKYIHSLSHTTQQEVVEVLTKSIYTLLRNLIRLYILLAVYIGKDYLACDKIQDNRISRHQDLQHCIAVLYKWYNSKYFCALHKLTEYLHGLD